MLKEGSRMTPQIYKLLSGISFIMGFASIIGSIAIWFVQGGCQTAPEAKLHAELFGIFVGLWAPTFFILSNRFDRYSDRCNP